jgi:hypothetical protein
LLPYGCFTLLLFRSAILIGTSLASDCQSVVTNLPVCANSIWDMYLLQDGYYVCCEPGQVGVNPVSGNTGLCEPPDSGVQSNLLATLASQIGGPPITTYPSGAGTSAMATSTGSATGTGGQESATMTVVGSTSTTTPTTTSTSTGSSGSGSSSSGSGSGIGATADNLGLSVGAIIGIAVAGGCIFILLILAIWLCCRRQSRRDPRYAAPYPVGGSYAAGYGNPAYTPQQGGGYEGQGCMLKGTESMGCRDILLSRRRMQRWRGGIKALSCGRRWGMMTVIWSRCQRRTRAELCEKCARRRRVFCRWRHADPFSNPLLRNSSILLQCNNILIKPDHDPFPWRVVNARHILFA